MSLKSSDLPDGVKSQVLRQVRAQVGSTQYDSMVATLGEDGLLDLVLEKVGEPSTSQAIPRRADTNPWLEAAAFLLILAGLLGWGPWPWMKVVSGILLWLTSIGPVGFAVALPSAYLLAVLFFYTRNLIRNTGLLWVVKAAGVVGAMGGVGCLLWFGGPWLFQGVRGWWAWLGGHF